MYDQHLIEMQEIIRQHKAAKPKVSLEKCAKAIWDWEYEGRDNEVLRVKWKLLGKDYIERAKAVLDSLQSQGIQFTVEEGGVRL